MIKLGQDEHKSETVDNSTNPDWNFTVAFDIMEASPRQISFEVFDDDTLGNVTLDTDAVMKKQKLENFWTRLENCKSGELLISAKFTPAEVVEELNAELINSSSNIKKEVITKHLKRKNSKEVHGRKNLDRKETISSSNL